VKGDLEPFERELGILVDFVEGRTDGLELDGQLAQEEMQTLLATFENPKYRNTSNHCRRLAKQDRTSIGGLLNSQGIVEDFLRKAEVNFTPTTEYRDLFDLILDSQPDYLDAPEDFIVKNVLPKDTTLSKSAKKKAMKEAFKEHFRSVKKPPKWIQEPDWPIVDGTPLVFIGQVPIESIELFHDTGAAYVFYEPRGGTFETIAQFH